MGRPVTVYTGTRLEEIAQAIEEYTETTELPILAEFAYQNNIDKAELYSHAELSSSIKRLIAKKEAQLERLGGSGKINVAMAIFSLKQLGWRDRFEVAHEIQEGKTNLEQVPTEQLTEALLARLKISARAVETQTQV